MLLLWLGVLSFLLDYIHLDGVFASSDFQDIACLELFCVEVENDRILLLVISADGDQAGFVVDFDDNGQVKIFNITLRAFF